MAERLHGDVTPTDDQDFTDLDKDAEDDIVAAAWQRLYLTLKDFDENDGDNADEYAFGTHIKINGDRSFYLGVNCAISDDEGMPEIVSVNLYHSHLHVQECIAKTNWENGTPNITDIDNHLIENPTEHLGLGEIATYAAKIVMASGRNREYSQIPTNGIFPIPEAYVASVH